MPENMALQALHGTAPQMFIDFSGTLWIPMDLPRVCWVSCVFSYP